MHLLAVTPIHVDDAELHRRQRRYDALAPETVTVELRNIGPEAPRSLETERDIRVSEQMLQAAFAAADPDGFDGYLPDCVLDPCAGDAESFARPLYGLSRLTASFFASQGLRIGALARNTAIAEELDRVLTFYGITSLDTTVLGLSVRDIADTAAWGRAVAQQTAGMTCDVAINACSAVDLPNPPTRPLVVDPTATALQLLALRVELGGTA